MSPTLSLLRVLAMQPRSLLSLVPKEAYTEMVTPLGILAARHPAGQRS
jgi:hypothetical protein